MFKIKNFKENNKNRLNVFNYNINSLIKNLNSLSIFDKKIIKTAELISKRIKNGNKILLCGNGGSAAEAQHIAAEYVCSLRHQFPRGSIPALALSTDTSIITAIGNDFGFDRIFERQIESFGKKGDILIAISTSGNSINVIKAIKLARKKGIQVIGLTGRSGGKMKNIVGILFNIPTDDTARIQECHLLIEHTICELVENILFFSKNGKK
jgi:D-sedoheptulose 7-phosphate isomerase